MNPAEVVTRSSPVFSPSAISSGARARITSSALRPLSRESTPRPLAKVASTSIA